jgi:predicted DNA binding CopG/RHH family protein
MSRAFTWIDPFDDMSDEEFDEHVAKLGRSRPNTVAVSLRIAPDLLARVKREATRLGVPYQTFMKRLLEAGTARLERKSATRHKRSSAG